MCHEMKKDENYWLRGQANMGSVEIHFEDQDETATVQGDTSANQNLDNFCVLVNALLDQKHSIFSHPIPKCRVNSGPSHSKQGRLCDHRESDILYLLTSFSFIIYPIEKG